MTVSIDQHLDREWRWIARSPRSDQALRRWAARHPVLNRARSLDGLLVLRRRPEAADPVLRALLAEGHHDQLAARVVLQALLPGLVKIAGDPRARQASSLDDIIGIAWQEIRDYPLDRPGRVACTIVRNTRRRFLDEFAAHGMLTERRFAPKATTPPGPEDRVLARLDLDAVVRGVDNGYVIRPTFQAVVRTRVLGETLAEVAETQGVTVHALTIRRLQAEAKLRLLEPVAA